ncbi:hypothetical protein AVEN_130068-1 [Araneus ventricosus]|uniref:Uncharacterized protein n=1 Tax=Araneus ventricosus TaxID=182803 RepID=A0A4Y2EK22_ARAVE|nr:hypothetical protein AVEN_130068-1 [Araneus ventricosus]
MMEDYSEVVSGMEEVISEEEDHIPIEHASSSGEEIETEGNLPDTIKSKDGKINHIQIPGGTTMPQAYVEHLTYLDLYSKRNTLVNISWGHPPAHSWYRSESPVLLYVLSEKGKTKQLWLAYHPVT